MTMFYINIYPSSKLEPKSRQMNKRSQQNVNLPDDLDYSIKRHEISCALCEASIDNHVEASCQARILN